MKVTWKKRHEDALNLLVQKRSEFVRDYVEARERWECPPEHYIYSLGELCTRFGLAQGAIAACCSKSIDKSTVMLETSTAILSAAEHLAAYGTYATFPFFSFRAQRMARDNTDRDPSTLLVRIQPVAKKMGATVPEAMEAVRKQTNVKVTRSTVRRWCSNGRPTHIRDEAVYKAFLTVIESMRDTREVDTEPVRRKFAAAFRA